MRRPKPLDTDAFASPLEMTRRLESSADLGKVRPSSSTEAISIYVSQAKSMGLFDGLSKIRPDYPSLWLEVRLNGRCKVLPIRGPRIVDRRSNSIKGLTERLSTALHRERSLVRAGEGGATCHPHKDQGPSSLPGRAWTPDLFRLLTQ